MKSWKGRSLKRSHQIPSAGLCDFILPLVFPVSRAGPPWWVLCCCHPLTLRGALCVCAEVSPLLPPPTPHLLQSPTQHDTAQVHSSSNPISHSGNEHPAPTSLSWERITPGSLVLVKHLSGLNRWILDFAVVVANLVWGSHPGVLRAYFWVCAW